MAAGELGKTKHLRETQRLIDGDDRPEEARKTVTLWLNVWKYPFEDTVLACLLGALLEKFTTDDWVKQLTGLLISQDAALNFILSLSTQNLPAIGPVIVLEPGMVQKLEDFL